jgi:hypothetical protein
MTQTPGSSRIHIRHPAAQRSAAFGREQKVDRLPGRIQRPIQIPVLAFYLYIGLIDPIALIGRVRWYLRYPLSYEHVSELVAERGVEVDASCIWRWVQAYAPELNKRCRPYLKPKRSLLPGTGAL